MDPLCLLLLIKAKLLCYEREIRRHEVLVRIQQRCCECEDRDHVITLKLRNPVAAPGTHCIDANIETKFCPCSSQTRFLKE